MSPNIPEFAIVFHGAAVAGVAVSTINPTYTAEEVAFQLRDSGSTLLITIAMFAETAAAAAADSPVTEIFIIGDAPEGMASFTDLMGAPIEQVDVDPDEQIVVLPYSSGTTGFPKGVMLTHRNLVANLVQCEDALEVEDGEVVLAVLPFFHIYGMQVLMNFFLSRGSTIVTVPRFDLEQSLGTDPGAPHHPALCCAAHCARARKASASRSIRPLQPEAGVLRCCTTGRRTRPRGGGSNRLRSGPGLRHDRNESGLARHSDGGLQAGDLRGDRRQHRVPHRRCRERRRPGCRRCG